MTDVPKPPRRPASFSLDELDQGPPTIAQKPRQDENEVGRAPRTIDDVSLLTIEADEAIDRDDEIADILAESVLPRRRGFGFARLFLAALGALVSIGIGLAIDDLIADLFARADWLGWTAVVLSGLAAIGLFGTVLHEAFALWRLDAIDRERRRALAAFEADDAVAAKAVVSTLVALVAGKPGTAEGRARLSALEGEVIDGRDMIALAEREILGPLDAAARALTLEAAKRVSVVTAVSPKALVDIAYVLFETMRLIRATAELYGARPGALGLARLTRDVLGHLAITGTMSIGDSVVGQVVGHGIAARLSARLGEGVVNGLLTARVGIAAMDVCRPMPFLRAKRPKISDFVSDLGLLQGEAERRRQVRMRARD